jgi:hypothetical protein
MAKRKRAADGPPSLTVAGATATIRFERPSEHNRIDPDDIPVLRRHLDKIATMPRLRAIVFTGAGQRTFSSGFTVSAILERLDRSFEDLLDAIEQFPLPTICALNGSVYGGATDLALCCDFRIGVRGTGMFMPAARFGLHYYPGGLRRFAAGEAHLSHGPDAAGRRHAPHRLPYRAGFARAARAPGRRVCRRARRMRACGREVHEAADQCAGNR